MNFNLRNKIPETCRLWMRKRCHKKELTCPYIHAYICQDDGKCWRDECTRLHVKQKKLSQPRIHYGRSRQAAHRSSYRRNRSRSRSSSPLQHNRGFYHGRSSPQRRSRSHSPRTPQRRSRSHSPRKRKRNYNSSQHQYKSRSRSQSRSSQHKYKSRSRSQSRSKSRTPPGRYRSRSHSPIPDRSKSPSVSPSRSKSRSSSPYRRKNQSQSPYKEKSPSPYNRKGRSPSPYKRKEQSPRSYRRQSHSPSENQAQYLQSLPRESNRYGETLARSSSSGNKSSYDRDLEEDMGIHQDTGREMANPSASEYSNSPNDGKRTRSDSSSSGLPVDFTNPRTQMLLQEILQATSQGDRNEANYENEDINSLSHVQRSQMERLGEGHIGFEEVEDIASIYRGRRISQSSENAVGGAFQERVKENKKQNEMQGKICPPPPKLSAVAEAVKPSDEPSMTYHTNWNAKVASEESCIAVSSSNKNQMQAQMRPPPPPKLTQESKKTYESTLWTPALDRRQFQEAKKSIYENEASNWEMETPYIVRKSKSEVSQEESVYEKERSIASEYSLSTKYYPYEEIQEKPPREEICKISPALFPSGLYSTEKETTSQQNVEIAEPPSSDFINYVEAASKFLIGKVKESGKSPEVERKSSHKGSEERRYRKGSETPPKRNRKKRRKEKRSKRVSSSDSDSSAEEPERHRKGLDKTAQKTVEVEDKIANLIAKKASLYKRVNMLVEQKTLLDSKRNDLINNHKGDRSSLESILGENTFLKKEIDKQIVNMTEIIKKVSDEVNSQEMIRKQIQGHTARDTNEIPGERRLTHSEENLGFGLSEDPISKGKCSPQRKDKQYFKEEKKDKSKDQQRSPDESVRRSRSPQTSRHQLAKSLEKSSHIHSKSPETARRKRSKSPHMNRQKQSRSPEAKGQDHSESPHTSRQLYSVSPEKSRPHHSKSPILNKRKHSLSPAPDVIHGPHRSRSPALNPCKDKKRPTDTEEKPNSKKLKEAEGDLLQYNPLFNQKQFIRYTDPGKHWCKLCAIFCDSAPEYIDHLTTPSHMGKAKNDRKTWLAKSPKEVQEPEPPNAQIVILPMIGVEFLHSLTAYYCSLCDFFMRSAGEAIRHPKSKMHVSNYKIHCSKNPVYDSSFSKAKMLSYAKYKIEEERSSMESKCKSKDKAATDEIEERLLKQVSIRVASRISSKSDRKKGKEFSETKDGIHAKTGAMEESFVKEKPDSVPTASKAYCKSKEKSQKCSDFEKSPSRASSKYVDKDQLVKEREKSKSKSVLGKEKFESKKEVDTKLGSQGKPSHKDRERKSNGSASDKKESVKNVNTENRSSKEIGVDHFCDKKTIFDESVKNPTIDTGSVDEGKCIKGNDIETKPAVARAPADGKDTPEDKPQKKTIVSKLPMIGKMPLFKRRTNYSSKREVNSTKEGNSTEQELPSQGKDLPIPVVLQYVKPEMQFPCEAEKKQSDITISEETTSLQLCSEFSSATQETVGTDVSAELKKESHSPIDVFFFEEESNQSVPMDVDSDSSSIQPENIVEVGNDAEAVEDASTATVQALELLNIPLPGFNTVPKVSSPSDIPLPPRLLDEQEVPLSQDMKVQQDLSSGGQTYGNEIADTYKSLSRGAYEIPLPPGTEDEPCLQVSPKMPPPPGTEDCIDNNFELEYDMVPLTKASDLVSLPPKFGFEELSSGAWSVGSNMKDSTSVSSFAEQEKVSYSEEISTLNALPAGTHSWRESTPPPPGTEMTELPKEEAFIEESFPSTNLKKENLFKAKLSIQETPPPSGRETNVPIKANISVEETPPPPGTVDLLLKRELTRKDCTPPPPGTESDLSLKRKNMMQRTSAQEKKTDKVYSDILTNEDPPPPGTELDLLFTEKAVTTVSGRYSQSKTETSKLMKKDSSLGKRLPPPGVENIFINEYGVEKTPPPQETENFLILQKSSSEEPPLPSLEECKLLDTKSDIEETPLVPDIEPGVLTWTNIAVGVDSEISNDRTTISCRSNLGNHQQREATPPPPGTESDPITEDLPVRLYSLPEQEVLTFRPLEGKNMTAETKSLQSASMVTKSSSENTGMYIKEKEDFSLTEYSHRSQKCLSDSCKTITIQSNTASSEVGENSKDALHAQYSESIENTEGFRKVSHKSSSQEMFILGGQRENNHEESLTGNDVVARSLLETPHAQKETSSNDPDLQLSGTSETLNSGITTEAVSQILRDIEPEVVTTTEEEESSLCDVLGMFSRGNDDNSFAEKEEETLLAEITSSRQSEDNELKDVTQHQNSDSLTSCESGDWSELLLTEEKREKDHDKVNKLKGVLTEPLEDSIVQELSVELPSPLEERGPCKTMERKDNKVENVSDYSLTQTKTCVIQQDLPLLIFSENVEEKSDERDVGCAENEQYSQAVEKISVTDTKGEQFSTHCETEVQISAVSEEPDEISPRKTRKFTESRSADVTRKRKKNSIVLNTTDDHSEATQKDCDKVFAFDSCSSEQNLRKESQPKRRGLSSKAAANAKAVSDDMENREVEEDFAAESESNSPVVKESMEKESTSQSNDVRKPRSLRSAAKSEIEDDEISNENHTKPDISEECIPVGKRRRKLRSSKVAKTIIREKEEEENTQNDALVTETVAETSDLSCSLKDLPKRQTRRSSRAT